MKYYVFEGVDGTGKSEIMKKVAEKLEEKELEDDINDIRLQVEMIREPEEPFRGILLNSDLLFEQQLLLFFADRMSTEMKYNFSMDFSMDLMGLNYHILLSDRSWLSSLVYQLLYGDAFNFDLGLFGNLYKWIDIKSIDKVFIIDSDEHYGDKSNKLDNLDRDKLRYYYKGLVDDHFKDSLLNKIYMNTSLDVYERMKKDLNNIELINNKNIEKTINEIVKDIGDDI